MRFSLVPGSVKPLAASVATLTPATSSTGRKAPARTVTAAWAAPAATVGRWILGLVFLVSGGIKALDAQAFIGALQAYHLPPWLYPPVYAVPSLEVGLGVALLVGLPALWTALAALAVLIAFSGLVVWGWIGGDLETCGCFGRLIPLSPGAALAKNAVLASLAALVAAAGARRPSRLWQVWALAIVLPAAGTLTGLSVHSPLLDSSLAQVGRPFPVSGFVEASPDLDDRSLIFVFHPRCAHCWDAVANVKALSAESGLPVLGVTYAEAPLIEAFAETFETDFPVYRFDRGLFRAAFRSWPALYYVERGQIRGKYEDGAPAPRTLEKLYLPSWS